MKIPRISQLKQVIGETVKFSATSGIASTLAATTLIASAVDAIDSASASSLVNTHSRRTNAEANVAAKILDIERSSLVNKNYLKLAKSIDDYLTGQTDQLVVDTSMFSNSQTLTEPTMQSDDVLRAMANIQSLLEEGSVDHQATAAEHSDSNVEIKVMSEAPKVEPVVTIELPKSEPIIAKDPTPTVKPLQPQIKQPISSVEPIDTQKTPIDKPKSDPAPIDLKIPEIPKLIKSEEPPKIARSEDPKVKPFETPISSEPSPTDASKYDAILPDQKDDQGMNVAISIVAKNDDQNAQSDAQKKDTSESLNDDAKDLMDQIKKLSDDRKSTVEDQSSDSNHSDKYGSEQVESEDPQLEDVATVGTDSNLSDLPDEDRVDHVDSRDQTTVNEVIEDIQSDQEIAGTITIHVHRKYANNWPIDDFKLQKATKGVRHADGSETWESVTFTAEDLTEDQKTFTSSKLEEFVLMVPDFSAVYTPTSADDTVSDRLTFVKKSSVAQSEDTVKEIDSDQTSNDQSSETNEVETVETVEEPKVATRVVSLIKEDGSVIESITQSSGNSITIDRVIGDLFTELSNLTIDFEEGDLSVTYKPIYSTVQKIEEYSVKNVDQNGDMINEYTQSFKVSGTRNNLENTEIYLAEQIESEADHQTMSNYEFSDTEFDHSAKTIRHRYIEKVQEVEKSGHPDRETVYSVASSMLSSMPTISNREEYSKFTTFEESYSRLLQKDAIESLVFELSEGYYDHSNSNRSLSAGQEAVLLSELNSRFTDRLLFRLNEFRRSLNLPELSKVQTSYEMDRRFASAVIYNYLYNGHSNSETGRKFEWSVGSGAAESMQPVHTISSTRQSLTPEAVADSMFRTILSEAKSYLNNDGGETGHLEQLLDADRRSVYSGMFIGGYRVEDKIVTMFGKQIKGGVKYSYDVSTTLLYFN